MAGGVLGVEELKRLDQTFNVVYADPPWKYERSAATSGLGGCADEEYETMSEQELRAFFRELGPYVEANALLFMWTTGPKLDVALRVGRDFGFEYTTKFLTWVKKCKTKDAPHLMPLGWWSLPCTEDVLLFKRGKTADFVSRDTRPSQLLEAPKAAHSEKPEAARRAIESMLVPERSRCMELFGRRSSVQGTCGWTVVGKQTSGAHRRNAPREFDFGRLVACAKGRPPHPSKTSVTSMGPPPNKRARKAGGHAPAARAT